MSILDELRKEAGRRADKLSSSILLEAATFCLESEKKARRKCAGKGLPILSSDELSSLYARLRCVRILNHKRKKAKIRFRYLGGSLPVPPDYYTEYKLEIEIKELEEELRFYSPT